MLRATVSAVTCHPFGVHCAAWFCCYKHDTPLGLKNRRLCNITYSNRSIFKILHADFERGIEIFLFA